MRETRTIEFKESIESNTFLKTISAYANYNKGQIIFGIQDDGTVIGIQNPEQACLNLENKINDNIKPVPTYILNITSENTIVLEVYEGPFKPYLYKGKAYKRNDSSTIEVDRLELNRLVLEGMNQSYEELDATSQELEFKTLESELISKLSINGLNEDILRTLGLYKSNKFNIAGELLSDHNSFLGVDIIRFGQDISEIMDRKTLDYISIIDMIKLSVDMYQKYYQYEKISGIKREKLDKIPEKAFREALANALVHRLWDIRARIKISMFDDRIEITSPGGLPAEVGEEDYLNGQISFLRNPIIGNVFFRLNYIEMFGSEIQRINQAYVNQLVKPIYKIFTNSITIILPVVIRDKDFTVDEQLIVQILNGHVKMSRKEIEQETGFSKDKTIRVINALIEKGVVVKTGMARNSKYIIKR